MSNNTILTFIETGFKHWEDISVHQNKYIHQYGRILPKNNIWSKYLNVWNSNDYVAIIIAMEETLEIKPELFQPYHIDTIEEIKKILLVEPNKTIWCKSHKKLIWKLIMIMKEIYNEMNNIPNTITILTPDHNSPKS